MRRSRDAGQAFWADRLGEPEVTAGLAIEAGPPFLGLALGLGGVAMLLLLLEVLGSVPDSLVFLVVGCAFDVGSLVTGTYVVRRMQTRRWIETVGSPLSAGMLLGVVADRLVIWRWPRRGAPPPGRLLDLALSDVSLRSRAALPAGLEIELPSGRTILVNHQVGRSERRALALVLDAVARAHGPEDGIARQSGSARARKADRVQPRPVSRRSSWPAGVPHLGAL